MRIGIDARKLADYGIGSYIRGLLGGLAEVCEAETYVVFAPAAARALLPEGFEHVALDAPHYSMRELVVVGRAIAAARLDLFHAPHYVVPFTSCPIVVTVHDLIHLHQRMRNPLAPLYARAMIAHAIRKSRRVLTVTEAVKDDLLATFGCAPDKVVAAPNGVDARFRRDAAMTPSRDFFLFVGNDKPHKNVGTLVEAFARVRAVRPDLRLLLCGAPFARYRDRDGVALTGFVRDEELARLYRNALAVVMPSLEEGFGLPAAEAMASGTAVITSQDPALVEITGDAALHAEARSVDALADAMLRMASDVSLRETLIARGLERSTRFSWRRCAELTRDVYVKALR